MGFSHVDWRGREFEVVEADWDAGVLTLRDQDSGELRAASLVATFDSAAGGFDDLELVMGRRLRNGR